MSKGSKAGLRLIKTRPDCKNCAVWKLCFTERDRDICVSKVRDILRERGPIAPGEAVYRRGDRFQSVYVVQSGVVKTETETIDGRLNVTGFYTSGDLFGLEGISSSAFPGRAIASRESWVCEIPYDSLLKICEENPRLQREFISRLSQRIQADEYDWKTVRQEPARHRVLYFLCEIHRRQEASRDDWNTVQLPMSKQDIANFLGLSPESLSRALKRLEGDGIIRKIAPDLVSISKNALKSAVASH